MRKRRRRPTRPSGSGWARHPRPAWTPHAARADPQPVTFLQAALFQFLNPKAWVMTVTAATLFLPRELGLIGSGAYMAGVMEGIGLPCMMAWALFGTSLHRVTGAPRPRIGLCTCGAEPRLHRRSRW